MSATGGFRLTVLVQGTERPPASRHLPICLQLLEMRVEVATGNGVEAEIRRAVWGWERQTHIGGPCTWELGLGDPEEGV